MLKKEFIKIKVEELIPYENNPRINDSAVADVIVSIDQCGNLDPIEIDEKNIILAGHTRRLAFLKKGIKETDAIRISGLTEEQKKKYRILSNKTSELAKWDLPKLEIELKGLDFEGYDFNFPEFKVQKSFFDDKEEWDDEREESEDYNEFLEKFKDPKTTDDCYTPDVIYSALVEWVEKEYHLDKSNFVRPFYPGGDYQNYKYKKNDVVVDNPPFSILSEIVKFYADNKIKFFLFCQGVTAFSSSSSCVLGVGVNITYENGANICTSFLTNLEDENIRAKSCPDLYKKINEANTENLKTIKKQLPKYKYPDNVVTGAMLNYLSKWGAEFSFTKKESYFIRELDSQKECNKGIFGHGFLLSEKAAAEKAAAEKAAAEKAAAEIWELSEREKEIIKKLG